MENLISNMYIFWSLIKTFTILDLIDIAIVSFLIYKLINLVKDTKAQQLLQGLAIILFADTLAHQLHLRMLTTLLSNFVQFSMIALLIVFQPELRRALEHIGRSNISNYWNFDNKFHNNSSLKITINIISDALELFSGNKIGALIIFEQKTMLGEIIDTGTLIKAEPSVELIGNIFYNKAPLHDGAMIVKNNLIYAAGCILPLTKNQNLSSKYGTRHRAALGMSENSDAICVVVSEETGNISIAFNGELKFIKNVEELKIKLLNLLSV